jgi:hypothetical protein
MMFYGLGFRGGEIMRLGKLILAVAAVSMASAPVLAQSAQPLSLANSPIVSRSSANFGDASGLDRRGIGIYLIGAVLLGLIIWGVIELTKSDEGPSSP